jgi:hypothetical protein
MDSATEEGRQDAAEELFRIYDGLISNSVNAKKLEEILELAKDIPIEKIINALNKFKTSA